MIFSRRHILLLIAIIVLALGLRAYRLDAQSLWNDEGTSVALAQRDLAMIIESAANDIHPPLYYILLHFWVRAFGISEIAVRSLSVFTGVLVVAGTYLLARALVSSHTALLAALVAALSPFQVYYAQETRMYILATLAGMALIGAFYALLRAWSHRAIALLSGEAVAMVLAGIATLYTHYYGATLLLVINIAFAIWVVERRRLGLSSSGAVLRWVVLQAIVAISFAPWLARTWQTLANWPAISTPMTLYELLAHLMVVLPLGITAPMSLPAMLAGAFSTALVLGGLAFLLTRDETRALARSRWPVLLLALYLIVPLGVMYIGSLRRPMYNPKFILLATPALHILQAAGIGVIARYQRGAALSPQMRVTRTVIAATLALLLLAGPLWSLDRLYHDPRYARDDYRGIVEYVRTTAGPGSAILINAPSQIETVDYYHSEPPPMYPLARQRPMDTAQTIGELEAIVADHDQLYGIFWATADSDPEGVIERWLAEHTFKTMDSWYGNIRLAVYATPPEGTDADYQPADYTLGSAIRLRGYRLLPASPRSGEILQLALLWEATEPVETRYTVFAQLLDANQHIVGQHDSEPVGGARPTDRWIPGDLIADNHGILIQPGTIPGHHTLVVGMYSQEDGVRLAVTESGRPAGDAIVLGKVPVAGPLRLPLTDELGIRVPHRMSWGSLELVGHSLYPVGRAHESQPSFHAQDGLELVLFWRKGGTEPPPEAMRLKLVDRMGDSIWQGEILPAHGWYDWDVWREGETVRDVWHIVLPPLAGGSGQLRLLVEPVSVPNGRTELLERIRVTSR